MSFISNKKALRAIYIGVLCSVSYLAVYIARNILGAVTPQMLDGGGFTTEYIGRLSSVYFITYAIGQLINGMLGDKIKAVYMISGGLLLAGITNFLFPIISGYPNASIAVYATTGFFLAMIYGPMTKVVAENCEPVYATRCSLGYTFASFLGSPLAGVLAAIFSWQSTFTASSLVLIIMAVVCFSVFMTFEKRGIVKYNLYKPETKKGAGIKVLIKNRIIMFTMVSVLTGIVRTTVVFWMPTYFSQYLGYDTSMASTLFAVATSVISLTTFIAIFVYERLRHNMDLTIFLFFLLATVFFGILYFINVPMLNVALMVLAIMSSGGAATMLFSRYCPSLRDTGMTSSATGFLDFMSYIAAAVSSQLFANAVSHIGWGNLILVWMGLMFIGVVISAPALLKNYCEKMR